ncbi:hypothetical protein AURDEDRAFT_177468 [Auricularia subglabra TFB-10046 SS5]|uniref:Uncharacterized protein n=1 Tax=Auricularia subglabra (strain TFB-10046 / SS5) TaxID=717982 RepID=J0WMA2_AURST|nr:hypothetical protein AURDEDRAFT_177468 [Auricularia subglabra TFB-10046 SS5]
MLARCIQSAPWRLCICFKRGLTLQRYHTVQNAIASAIREALQTLVELRIELHDCPQPIRQALFETFDGSARWLSKVSLELAAEDLRSAFISSPRAVVVDILLLEPAPAQFHHFLTSVSTHFPTIQHLHLGLSAAGVQEYDGSSILPPPLTTPCIFSRLTMVVLATHSFSDIEHMLRVVSLDKLYVQLCCLEDITNQADLGFLRPPALAHAVRLQTACIGPTIHLFTLDGIVSDQMWDPPTPRGNIVVSQQGAPSFYRRLCFEGVLPPRQLFSAQLTVLEIDSHMWPTVQAAFLAPNLTIICIIITFNGADYLPNLPEINGLSTIACPVMHDLAFKTGPLFEDDDSSELRLDEDYWGMFSERVLTSRTGSLCVTLLREVYLTQEYDLPPWADAIHHMQDSDDLYSCISLGVADM